MIKFGYVMATLWGALFVMFLIGNYRPDDFVAGTWLFLLVMHNYVDAKKGRP